MSSLHILSKVTPINLREEKQRFFDSDSYNPQFIYPASSTTEELHAWGQASASTAEFVRQHLRQLPPDNPSRQELTPREIELAVTNVLQQLGIESQLQVAFDDTLVSKCRIELTTLTFRVPILYHRHELPGVINHEIQTHLLRRLNDQLQPWHNSPRPDPLFRATEEGLALLNAYFGSGEKSMIGSYTAYYAMYLSQETSFREGFETLVSLGLSNNRAWRLMVRGKRGIADTSQPLGGLSKDICYLQGAAQVWRWLTNQHHDPHHLYWGRIGLEELSDLEQKAVKERLIYPTFFDDIPNYLDALQKLGKANFLDTIPL